MADHGALTFTTRKNRVVRQLPLWRSTTAGVSYYAIDVSGTLSGTVSISGSPVVGATLVCVYRSTGKRVGITTTDSSGNYQFTGLDTNDAGAYAVIWLDNTSGNNAQILDKLTAG